MEVRHDNMLKNVIKQSQIERYEPEVNEITGVSAMDFQVQNRLDPTYEIGLFERQRERLPFGALQFEEVTDP
jgi:hypothetical protein